MTNQMELLMKREKAACRCIEWQECLRCAEEDGDKELIRYCRQKVEKYLAKIKKITLAPDYKSNCKSKSVVKPVRRRTFSERKQIMEIEMDALKFVKGSQGIIAFQDQASSTYSFIDPGFGAIIIEKVRYQGSMIWRYSVYRESCPNRLQEECFGQCRSLAHAKEQASFNFNEMKKEMAK